MPTVAYIGAQQVLALISVCNRDYIIQGRHGALLTMAFVLAAIFFNTYAIGKLPVLEGLAVVLHIFGFFAFIVILWVMGPRASAEETFTVFRDDNHVSRLMGERVTRNTWLSRGVSLSPKHPALYRRHADPVAHRF